MRYVLILVHLRRALEAHAACGARTLVRTKSAHCGPMSGKVDGNPRRPKREIALRPGLCSRVEGWRYRGHYRGACLLREWLKRARGARQRSEHVLRVERWRSIG